MRISPISGPGVPGHLLDADHENDARGLGRDGAQALVHGRGPGGAGILDTGRGLEAQAVIGLQHQRSGEILGREPGVEMPQHDLVDIVGPETGILQRRARHARDEPLDGFGVLSAEGCMGPSDDTCCHGVSPLPEPRCGFAECCSAN